MVLPQPVGNFNPLPRKEGDGDAAKSRQEQGISIHSLVKRETPKARACRSVCTDFNPLPRKEGDRKYS